MHLKPRDTELEPRPNWLSDSNPGIFIFLGLRRFLSVLPILVDKTPCLRHSRGASGT